MTNPTPAVGLNDLLGAIADAENSANSVDDIERSAYLCIRAMRFRVICDLVAHAGFQCELAPVFEFGVKPTR